MTEVDVVEWSTNRCISAASVREWVGNRERHVDEKQAKQFGHRLKQLRTNGGLSLRQLRDLTGIDDGLLSKMESGQIASPNPDKLHRLSEALGVPLADLYTMAAYELPTELPSPAPYLRAKYGDLPPEAVDALSDEISRVLAHHGITAEAGPAPGEDEAPEPKSTKKKGGSA